MTSNGISDKYKEDFLAHVCDAVEPNLRQSGEEDGIGYFLQRLNSIEAKAQADGLSEELLFEILSYSPDIDEESSK